jgi:ADP-heptose:LPS heptosyltransferase
MKFLVIRFSSIGDVVLTSPVVRCLRTQLPDAEIHFLIRPAFQSVLVNNPYITKLHLLQESISDTVDTLKEERFDYVIDLQRNLRSLRIKRGLKVPAFSFKKLNFQKLVFTKLKWNVMPKQVHVVDRYLNTVNLFGVYNDGAGLDYFIKPGEEVSEKDIPASHHAGFISVVIGGSFYTKKLPVYKLKELCSKIDHPIILLGGPEDATVGEEIKKVDSIKVYNACGKFSLNESADLIRRSKLVVSHDTGLMHIAAAYKKQIITVWGSTTPSFGMYPYYGVNFLSQQITTPCDDIQVHKLWCRPCTKIGKRTCPQGHFKCMKNISIDELVLKVNERLGRTL